MTRIALCLRGGSALRVRLVPEEAAADGKSVSGAGADKALLHQVDATQLEHACAAVLWALNRGGVVCESDGLQRLDKTQGVEGTPLERACLWRAALEVLVSTGHVTRLGPWYTAASTYCVPMHAVAPSDDQGATVTVAVQLARGRLAPVRRPKELKRGKRRPRALGRVQKNRRPRVKTERLAQRKAPKNGDKPVKKMVRRVTFVAGL